MLVNKHVQSRVVIFLVFAQKLLTTRFFWLMIGIVEKSSSKSIDWLLGHNFIIKNDRDIIKKLF